jgi:hypothetical protein
MAGRDDQRSTVDVVAKITTRAPRSARELLREAMRVARLVGRRVVAADQQRPRRASAGSMAMHSSTLDRSPLAAEVAHHCGGGTGDRELAAIGIDMQDAAFEMIVVERGFGAQRLQLTRL